MMRVSARLKPSSCVPPSTVWMLFANERMNSLKLSVYCMAISQVELLSAAVAAK